MLGEEKYTINIHYRHRKTGILTKKAFSLSLGQESSLESQLRTAFAVGKDEGLLLHCNETIFYPVSMINLAAASSSASCELQSFPLAAMNDMTNLQKTENRPVKRSKTSRSSHIDSSDNMAAASLGKEDKRRFNRGLDQRRSYLKEEKIFVMLMKDTGKTADEISNSTGVSKSNVEKWCSEKVREKMLVKFRQEIKHPVVEETLKENPLHFSTKEPAKFKLLLELLAEKLHAAQNHHQVAAGTYQIPPSVFWNVTSQQTIDKNTGRRQFVSIYSIDSALQYVLNQGFFFKRKADKDSSSVTTHDKDSLAKDLDDHSMEDVTSNYPDEMITESIPSDFLAIPSNNTLPVRQTSLDTLANLSANPSAFISSEESEMVDFALDDQSIASSQWALPLNASNTAFATVESAQGRRDVPFTVQLEEEDFDTDDDLDYDDVDEVIAKIGSTDYSKPRCSSPTQVVDVETVQSMIRQGIVPKLKPNKVCNRPVECREELVNLLRDDCQGSSTRFVKSDCTMQFRGKIQCTVPVNENLPNHLLSLTAIVPLHATRGVLRNTKYLSAIRDSLNGKILTEEEEEDAAVLSLLGE